MARKKARTIIGYAESGDGKTSQGYHIAKHVYETTGKITRWICADGGGWAPVEEAGLIESGVVQAFDITKRAKALADIHRLADGYWPRVVEQDGKKRRLFENVAECQTSAEEWNSIGAYVIEGIQSIGRSLLTHIAKQPDKKVAFAKSYHWQEDDYIAGGLDQGHYGLVQTELHSIIVQGFNLLPVDLVYYSTIVGKGEIKRTSDTIYGPQAVGSALTQHLPTWVGDCLHFSREQVIGKGDDETVKVQLVAWFQNHPDYNTGINYLAKTRLTPEQFPIMLKAFPSGHIALTFDEGIRKYLRVVEKLAAISRDAGRKWKEEVDARRKEAK